MKEKISIYTDGSCIGNPGPGGWAAIILYKNEQNEIFGNHKDTTNNRMEMTAIIKGLEWLHIKAGIEKDDLNKYEIEIFSDSNLIIQTINQGWKRKANTELWAEIDRLKAWLNIKWTWVKAHAENKYNNTADSLAFNEAQKLKKTKNKPL